MMAFVASLFTHIANQLLGPRRVVIPKMPALGLLLEYPIFDIYNRKITEANSKLEPNSAERRDPIDFESHRAQIDEFKQTHIYANMRAIEDRTGLSAQLALCCAGV
jgi:tRNA pseudouridine38-40 synthase